MGDPGFGEGLPDTIKLAIYRGKRSGVQHRHDISPADPEPGEAVTIRVVTQGSAAFDRAALYYTVDGRIPSGSRGVVATGTPVELVQDRVEWDALLWDYVVHWRGGIPGQPDGTLVQYVISAWSEAGNEAYADWPDMDEQVHLALGRHYEYIAPEYEGVQSDHYPGDTVFCYHVDTHRVPAWAREAIIYHLFVDRFYPGDGKDWVQTDDLGEVCGGTLWGVRDKLDYLADLGINCLWLTPTWVSETYHRYDVIDYRRTDPRLGGDEALRAVIEGAHQRGIRVLLDMVCNHTSYAHPIFKEAQQDVNSPYRDWLHFDDRLPDGYKTFMTFGVPSMPQINLNHPPAREWMIENAQYWLREFDVDGFRLDVADGVGLNFWAHFRVACRAIKPDCYVFGEITDTPDRLRKYAGRLDGNLAYPTWYMLRRTFVWEAMTEVQLAAYRKQHAAYMPADYAEPVFLDSADNNRMLFVANGDTEKLKRAAACQMQIRHPVVIYYGTEVGLSQPAGIVEESGHMNRLPMLWGDDQDQDLLAFYKDVIQARKQRARKQHAYDQA